MPISKINADGTADLYGATSGRVIRNVKPEDLAEYNPILVGEYEKLKTEQDLPENVVARASAAADAKMVAEGKDPVVEREIAKTTRASQAKQGLADQEQREQFKGVSALLKRAKEQAAEAGVTDIPGSIIGSNKDIENFDTTKKLAAQMLAKKIEGGRLSDADRKFYQDEIVKLSPFGLSRGKEQTVDNLVTNLALAAGLDPAATEEKEGEKDDKGNFIVDVVKGMAKPFIETGKNVGEAVYQTGLTALPGGPQDYGSMEQKVRAGETALPTSVFRSEEELGDLKKLALDQALNSGSILLDAAGAKFLPGVTKAVAGKAAKVATPVVKPVAEVAGKGVEAAKKAFGAVVKKAGPKYGDDILEQGLKMKTEGIANRKALVESAQGATNKVTGSKVFKGIQQWAKEEKATGTTAEAKQVDDLLVRARKFYKGKDLNPKTAMKRWDTADAGFKASGDAGDTMKAGYHRAIRDALRPELEKVAPGFEQATATIKKGIETEDILKSVRTGIQREDIRKGIKSPVAEFAKKTGAGVATTAASIWALQKLGFFGGQSSGQ